MAGADESQRARAAAVLTAAIDSLPEEDRRLVLAEIVERSLLRPAPPTAGLADTTVASAPVPRPMGEDWAARAARELLAGKSVHDIAEAYGTQEDAMAAAFRDVASRPDTPEPLSAVLGLIAEGRTRSEAAEELGLSADDVSAELERLLPSPAARRLEQALQTHSMLTHLEAFAPATNVGPGRGAPLLGAPAAAGGAQRMFPVRLPEAQYARLKEWCGAHRFAMAVVVRGLVERFLDEQDRRAA